MATQKYSRPPFSPTRFPAGVTNANAGDVLGNFAAMDPTKLQVFFEDFMAAPAALGVSTGIAGAGGLATVATTVANDTPTACFALSSTKRWFFVARLSLATVANSVKLGFANDLAAVTDGLTVNIANNVLTAANTITSAVTESATATLATVDATMYQVGFAYTPGKGVKIFVDDAQVAHLTSTTFTAVNLVAGFIPTGATATVDYWFAAIER